MSKYIFISQGHSLKLIPLNMLIH